MNNLAHNIDARPSESSEPPPSERKRRRRRPGGPTRSAAHQADGSLIDATLLDAGRAEVARVRAALRSDPAKAEAALDVVLDVLDSIENKVNFIVALAREAEEKLAPAVLIFARVDHALESSVGSGRAGAADRAGFSLSVGQAATAILCIPREAEDLTREDTQ